MKAGNDLGICVISPYVLHGDGPVGAEFIALIPQFGRAKGMLLLASEDGALKKLAVDNGFGYSCLNADCYGDYFRDLFVDTLNDWGWTPGQETAPIWYTGEPW